MIDRCTSSYPWFSHKHSNNNKSREILADKVVVQEAESVTVFGTSLQSQRSTAVLKLLAIFVRLGSYVFTGRLSASLRSIYVTAKAAVCKVSRFGIQHGFHSGSVRCASRTVPSPFWRLIDRRIQTESVISYRMLTIIPCRYGYVIPAGHPSQSMS